MCRQAVVRVMRWSCSPPCPRDRRGPSRRRGAPADAAAYFVPEWTLGSGFPRAILEGPGWGL